MIPSVTASEAGRAQRRIPPAPAGRELWRSGRRSAVGHGARVLLIGAPPMAGVRPLLAPGRQPSRPSLESGCLGMQPKAGGKLHLRLNTGASPIANKYREGKLKRTLEREFNST